MENLIIGFLAGLVIFGLLWQFVLKNKKDENKVDDTELKIDLAKRETELKASEDAKQDLKEQFGKKEQEVKDLYKVADAIGEYKSQTEKAINKHSVKIITDENFDDEVVKSSKPFLLDAWAAWCQPCIGFAKHLEKISEDMSDIITVGKINVEEQPNISSNPLAVRALPSFFLYVDGKMKASRVGATDPETMKQWIKDNLI